MGLIGKNIALLGAGEETRVIRQDATRLPDADAPCDLVFLDPPYGRDLVAPALATLLAGHWLAEDAVAVVETAKDEGFEPGPGWEEVDRRQSGAAEIVCLRRV